jgi:small Trp-rich protein
MWFLIVGVLLLLLKLLDIGPFGQWSGWVVAIPFVCAVLWWAWADKMGYTQKQEMKKMDERKEARRLKAMEALGTHNPNKAKRK